MALQPIKNFLWGSKFNRSLARVLPSKYTEPNPDFTLLRLGRRTSAGVFFALDRVGLHVIPKHYSTPVPDFEYLRNHGDHWRAPVEMRGIEWNLDHQLAWLKAVCEPYYGEVHGLAEFNSISDSGIGPGFGPIESQLLHCFIRSQRPSKVIEIGSGVSTRIILEAARRNEREGQGTTHIFAIEPNPRDELRKLAGITLNESIVQRVPIEFFDQLEAGDLLFVDSSHAVKTGSDVVRICMEIIPRLKPGIFVHFHDISLPYLYPRFALNQFFGWQESTLVMALLMNNAHIKVLCCQSALHYDRPDEMAAITTDYRPQPNNDGLAVSDGPTDLHCPDSLWLQTS